MGSCLQLLAQIFCSLLFKLGCGMVRNTERPKLVRALGVLAKACGLQAVREEAARGKVKEMMETIRMSSGPATSKKSAKGIWKA